MARKQWRVAKGGSSQELTHSICNAIDLADPGLSNANECPGYYIIGSYVSVVVDKLAVEGNYHVRFVDVQSKWYNDNS